MRRPGTARALGVGPAASWGLLCLALVAGCEEAEGLRPDAGSPDAPIDAGLGDAAPMAPAPADAGPPPDSGAPDAGIDCGPHGDAHFDHCHCHTGYVEREGRCVLPDDCAGEDTLEPDDRFRDAVEWADAPMDRWLCPGDRDHVRATVTAGDQLTVTARFEHESVDVNLALWAPGADPRFDRAVARADGQRDEERLSFRVLTSGEHLLRVYSPDRGAQGAYQLELTTVETPED